MSRASASVDPLSPQWLRGELIQPGVMWQRVEVVARTGSTNADLVAAARVGEVSGAVIVADHQVAGRGRRGRTWVGPAGANVAMSVLLRPTVPPERWTWLPLLGGIAVVEAVRRMGQSAGYALPAMLKWPNDVLVEGRKLSGILAERVETPSGPACVIGIGINVHLNADELPVPTATSLRLLAGDDTPSRGRVIVAVLRVLNLLLDIWEQSEDDTAFALAYVSRCATIGREVRVILADEQEVVGIADAVDSGGRLILRTHEGRAVVGAGDVIHVR